MNRPNILMLMADQLSPSALAAYGNPFVQTPNLSALAERAVVFESAYCNSPLCAPSRFSMLAGQLPSRIGAYDNAAEFASDIPTLSHRLRSGGYRTILAGKMHFVGPDQLHGFEERLTTDIYPADFGWTPDWTQFEQRPTWYHSMDSVLNAGVCVRSNQLDFDEETVFQSRRRLFDIARDADDRPFFMCVSLTHPHDPFAIPQRYWDLYRHDDVPMPRNPLARDARDPHSARIAFVCDLDDARVTDAHVRTARHAYYGAISFVDEQIGIVMDALEQSGMADNTVVVITSDHGEMLGERGLWYKMNFFEGGARVPLIVAAPARFAPARVAQSVSLVDLLPTFLDLAGLADGPDYPAETDGRSLLPHLQARGGHDEVIGEYLGEAAIAPVVMIRRGDWKFIHSRVDPDQLYNMRDDPDELCNRATDSACADRIAALRAEVDTRWDLPGIEAEVLDSQRRRRIVGAANATGALAAWDFQPRRDAAQQYIRAHLDLEELEAAARFPRVR